MELISITNDVVLAKYFERSGINDIMIDLEILGKKERQRGLNTVISEHCINDIAKIKSVLDVAKCLVRVNPIHNGSKHEIDDVLTNRPDILMLPMFTTVREVQEFVDLVGDRAMKYLLLETPQALVRIDDILDITGIDAIHVGLNDLSIAMGLDFLYEPLIGGLIDYVAKKLSERRIKFGFGGISRISKSKLILSEHYRLGSSMVIINRDFRNYKDNYDELILDIDMGAEIQAIRDYNEILKNSTISELERNRLLLKNEIKAQIYNMLNKDY